MEVFQRRRKIAQFLISLNLTNNGEILISAVTVIITMDLFVSAFKGFIPSFFPGMSIIFIQNKKWAEDSSMFIIHQILNYIH